MVLHKVLKKLGLKKEKKPKTIKKTDPVLKKEKSNTLKKGDKVVLVSNYKTFTDASEGPLKPGDVAILEENDYSFKPFRIEFNDVVWWYDVKALKLYE